MRVRVRVHEPEFEVLRLFDMPGVEVLDVGANRGQSVRSLLAVMARPSITAIEPNPILAEHIARTYRKHDVTVHSVGLAAASGRFDLFLPRYGHTVYDTRASLLAEHAESFLSASNFWPFRHERCGIERLSIPVVRLDDLGLSPHIVKIDVEGGLHDVLAGATATLDRARPLLLVEDARPDVVAMLHEAGYCPATYRLGRLRLDAVGDVNTLFVQPHHIDVIRRHGAITIEDAMG